MTLSTKNLIIIAGPSASGKSYLIRKILNDQNQKLMLKIMPELSTRRKLTIGKINLERLTNKIKIHKRSKKMRKDLHIVHFDLTCKNQLERRSQLRAISSECKSIKIITIRTTFKTWKKRMAERVKNELAKMPTSQAFWIYALSLFNIRIAKHLFESVYEDWDSFLNTISSDGRVYIDN